MTMAEPTAASIGAMPDPNDANAIPHALFATGASFDEFTSQMRRGLSLNAHERLAISALWARGPMTMSELGTWIPLSRAAVTTLVDRLVDAGLVVRGSDPHDRRRTVVTVTSAALDRMVPLLGSWGEAVRQLVSERSAEEWSVIATFLTDWTALNRVEAERLAALSDEAIQELTNLDAPPGAI